VGYNGNKEGDVRQNKRFGDPTHHVPSAVKEDAEVEKLAANQMLIGGGPKCISYTMDVADEV
jgi:hypothetical protein